MRGGIRRSGGVKTEEQKNTEKLTRGFGRLVTDTHSGLS